MISLTLKYYRSRFNGYRFLAAVKSKIFLFYFSVAAAVSGVKAERTGAAGLQKITETWILLLYAHKLLNALIM